MPESIYIVSPETKQLTGVDPVSFSDIGVREREDLEQWITNNPGILGEELLVITSEFDRFDKSNLRLDILAMDKEANLVIVELKLAAERSLADLQAIRYAAFCSAMTVDDVVQELARFANCSEEEAQARIKRFVSAEELPEELNNRPRIIIAAGSLDDEESTSSVLWLRNFGVDITCVELTPYRLSGTGQVLLVPKVIIPLPEAGDYVVNVERKELLRAERLKKTDYSAFWTVVGQEFNGAMSDFSTSGRTHGNSMAVPVGVGGFHYEWFIRKTHPTVAVAFHCETDDIERNLSIVNQLAKCEEDIRRDIDLKFEYGKFGQKWAHAQFLIPYEGDRPDEKLAPEAARIMRTFIERTWPLLKDVISK